MVATPTLAPTATPDPAIPGETLVYRATSWKGIGSFRVPLVLGTTTFRATRETIDGEEQIVLSAQAKGGVPGYPYDATILPDGSEVWICGASGDSVVVIDRVTNSITHRIPVGEYPNSVVFTDDDDDDMGLDTDLGDDDEMLVGHSDRLEPTGPREFPRPRVRVRGPLVVQGVDQLKQRFARIERDPLRSVAVVVRHRQEDHDEDHLKQVTQGVLPDQVGAVLVLFDGHGHGYQVGSSIKQLIESPVSMPAALFRARWRRISVGCRSAQPCSRSRATTSRSAAFMRAVTTHPSRSSTATVS